MPAHDIWTIRSEGGAAGGPVTRYPRFQDAAHETVEARQPKEQRRQERIPLVRDDLPSELLKAGDLFPVDIKSVLAQSIGQEIRVPRRVLTEQHMEGGGHDRAEGRGVFDELSFSCFRKAANSRGTAAEAPGNPAFQIVCASFSAS